MELLESRYPYPLFLQNYPQKSKANKSHCLFTVKLRELSTWREWRPGLASEFAAGEMHDRQGAFPGIAPEMFQIRDTMKERGSCTPGNRQ